jgi:hypothetical protein
MPTSKSAERTVPVGGFAPKLISFDVFGTLISVRESSYAAFQSILDDVPLVTGNSGRGDISRS